MVDWVSVKRLFFTLSILILWKPLERDCELLNPRKRNPQRLAAYKLFVVEQNHGVCHSNCMNCRFERRPTLIRKLLGSHTHIYDPVYFISYVCTFILLGLQIRSESSPSESPRVIRGGSELLYIGMTPSAAWIWVNVICYWYVSLYWRDYKPNSNTFVTLWDSYLSVHALSTKALKYPSLVSIHITCII